MLRLELHAAPRWIDLLPGARVQVAPMTSAVWMAARAENDPTEAADAPDAAIWSVAVLKSVANRVILDWAGIGDEEGTPIPPSEAAISALLDRNDAWDAFNEKVFAPWFLVSAEKNVFAPSHGSTSARATIAVDVPGSAPPAQGENTPPERPRAG